MIRNNSHQYIYQMYDTKYETKERNKKKPTNFIYNYINVYYNYHSIDYLIILLNNDNV